MDYLNLSEFVLVANRDVLSSKSAPGISNCLQSKTKETVRGGRMHIKMKIPTILLLLHRTC